MKNNSLPIEKEQNAVRKMVTIKSSTAMVVKTMTNNGRVAIMEIIYATKIRKMVIVVIEIIAEDETVEM